MPEVFLNHNEIIKIKKQDLQRLKRAAKKAPLKRSRFCLHQKTSEQVQEMVIAFCRDSYIRPHRHLNKSESFHIIQGNLMVVFFDEKGLIRQKIKMGHSGSGKTFLYRLNTNLWHTVVPLSDYVILHETTCGPFMESGQDFAPWAPDADNKNEVAIFLKNIRKS